MDTEKLGLLCVALGAGREKKEDAIDFSAGLVLHKKTGDKVCPGDVLATVYTNREGLEETVCERYLSSLLFTSDAPEKKPLIYTVIH